jgi:hypothetical protein
VKDFYEYSEQRNRFAVIKCNHVSFFKGIIYNVTERQKFSTVCSITKKFTPIHKIQLSFLFHSISKWMWRIKILHAHLYRVNNDPFHYHILLWSL